MQIFLKKRVWIPLYVLFIFVLGSLLVKAGWDEKVYEIFDAGVYEFEAATPGIHTHYAQNRSDVKASCEIKFDANPPTLLNEAMVISADSEKEITLEFDDANLSGVASVFIQVENLEGEFETHNFTQESTITFKQDFSRVGKYDFAYRACDEVGNCESESIPDFFEVVASTPEWEAENCVGLNYEAACPSNLLVSTGSKIADGKDTHSIEAKLVDKYGNRVIPKDGVKDIEVAFYFDNTTSIDQTSKNGEDAASFTSILQKEEILDTSGKQTEIILREATRPKGEYLLSIASYSPTSNSGYTPISEDGFKLDFYQAEYRIKPAGPYNDIGQATQNITPKDGEGEFQFYPALTATPIAMSFNPASGVYEASASANYNLSLNSPKRFLATLTNNSNLKNISQTQLGFLFASMDSNIVWKDGVLEKPYSKTLKLDTLSPFNSIWNNLPSALQNISKAGSQSFEFQATPTLAKQNSNANLQTAFQIYIGYSLDGKRIRYKGEALDLGLESNENATSNIQIIKDGKPLPLTNPAIEKLIGEVAHNQAKAIITRNTASLINNPQASQNACKEKLTIDANAWNSLGCKFEDGNLLYFENSDVVLNTVGGILALPDGAKTLLVNGGNIYIKSNLIYTNDYASFGLIALEGKNGGGNIYLYPQVTNIVGIAYAEGSLLSVNHVGKSEENVEGVCASDGSDGFCDRAAELNNQLFWKGLVIAANTVGGSDAAIPHCPSAFEAFCKANSKGSVTLYRLLARMFDLNNLRTFHANSVGIRAGRNKDGSENVLLPDPPTTEDETNNYAFILEYDERAEDNPPPLLDSLPIGF